MVCCIENMVKVIEFSRDNVCNLLLGFDAVEASVLFSIPWAPFKCHATSLAQVLMGLPVMFEIYWSGNTFAILQIQTFITLSLLSFHLLSEIPVLTAMRKNVFNYDETVWSFGGGK